MEDPEDPEMATAVRVFAHYLGVDLDTELDLLPAVKEAFYNLPEDWDIGIGDGEHAGIPYFFNVNNGESEWKHPREEQCFRAVRIAREAKKERERELAKERNAREREREKSRESDNRRNNNGRSGKPEVSDVVSMMEEVEDLEDIPSTRNTNQAASKQAETQGKTNTNTRARSSSPGQTHEVKTRSMSNANKGGFGMSSDDFLDEDDVMPDRTDRADRRTSTTASAGAGTGAGHSETVDNSLSPPLFKEMRNQKTTEYDSDDARNMKGKFGTGRDGERSTSLVNSNTGVSEGAVTSGWASALGAAQSDADRERDRERSSSNMRGRNNAAGGDGDERRGSVGGRGRGGRDDDRGWRGGGERGRGERDGRDQFRDDPRDRRDGSRDARDRDGRDGRDGRDNRDSRGGREGNFRDTRDDEGSRFSRRDDNRDTNRDGNRDWNRDSSRDGRGERDQGGRGDRPISNQRGSVSFQSGTLATASSNSNHVSDKERELRAEVDKYQVDVRKMTDDNLELAEKLAHQRTKHANELSTLREDVARLELRLAEERRERKVLEEQVTHAHAEHHSKARDLEDVHEIRLREAVRKARADTEEEYREKVRTAERRSVEELDAARAEMAQLKRKLEEALREADSAKRKISLSKADGKLEAQAEIDALRTTLREAEEHDRQQSLELRRLREENASAQGRLVGALQAVQLANAECDALRATAHTAVHDEQTHSGAVQAAMQRIQILDTEGAQVKAENIILRREKEAYILEIRKLRGTATFSGDRLNTTESEARRIKAQAQAETGRLQSRVTELEALTSVLRGQLDQAASHEAQAVREVSREYDTLDSEVLRLRDRLADREVKEEALNSCIKTHERELIRLQEVLFKKDRQIRDEQEGKEGINAQIESIRRGYEAEIEDLKALLAKQKQANSELAIAQRRESERLETEIAEKVPELIASAVSRVEAQWAAKHAQKCAEMKLHFDHAKDKLRAENHDLQALFSEKEARQRLNATDEKIELEKLRNNNKTLQRRCEELEEQTLELRRQLRVSHNNSHYFGATTPGTAQSRRPGRFPATSASYSGHPGGNRSVVDVSNMHDQSYDNVRHSTGFMPQYDARFDNSHIMHSNIHSNMHDENVYDAHNQNAQEEELMSHTVSFINDQLSYMKKQISSTLSTDALPAARHSRHAHSAHNTTHNGATHSNVGVHVTHPPHPPAHAEDSALIRADDAIDAINQSVLGMQPSTATNARTPAYAGASSSRSTAVPSSILSQHHPHNSSAAHHVKFSPEALFHSPQHPSANRGTHTRDHGDRADSVRQSEDSVSAARAGYSDSHDVDAQVETLDEHRSAYGQRAGSGTQTHAQSHSQEPVRANVRDTHPDSSVLSDYSLNNLSYIDNPSVNSTYNTYTMHMSGSRGGNSVSGTGRGALYGMSAGVNSADFSAISDGGYHEGYWRAKYQRPSKQ